MKEAKSEVTNKFVWLNYKYLYNYYILFYNKLKVYSLDNNFRYKCEETKSYERIQYTKEN